MAITKQKRLGQIEILADGTIFVKEYDEIIEDGVVISSVPHRKPIMPTEIISESEHQMVKDVAEKIWTPELKASFIAAEKIKNNKALNGN